MTEDNNTPNVDNSDSFNRASGSSPPVQKMLSKRIEHVREQALANNYPFAYQNAGRIAAVIDVAIFLFEEEQIEDWTTAVQIAAQIVLTGRGGAA